jgi:hypothetical protein
LQTAIEIFQDPIAPLNFQILGLVDVAVHVKTHIHELFDLCGNAFSKQRGQAKIGDTRSIQHNIQVNDIRIAVGIFGCSTFGVNAL